MKEELKLMLKEALISDEIDTSTEEKIFAEAEKLIKSYSEIFDASVQEYALKGEQITVTRNDIPMHMVIHSKKHDLSVLLPLFKIEDPDKMKLMARLFLNIPSLDAEHYVLVSTAYVSKIHATESKAEDLYKEMMDKYGSVGNFPEEYRSEQIMMTYEHVSGKSILKLCTIDDSGTINYTDKDEKKGLNSGRLANMLNDQEFRSKVDLSFIDFGKFKSNLEREINEALDPDKDPI